MEESGNERGNRWKGNASDLLANERTFLAWVRTGIGIMAFGFVVVKFSLFIKQLAVILGNKVEIQPKGYSSITGIVLVAFGILLILFSFLSYKRTEKQLNAGDYRQSGFLTGLVALFIFAVGMFLLIYLIEST
jgi:putative membrane protein